MSESRPRQETALSERQWKVKSLVCPKCDKGPFSNFNGLSQHHNKMHNSEVPPDTRLESKEWCELSYIKENMSLSEIADCCGTSIGVVRNWLQKHGITIDAKYGEHEYTEKLHNPDWLWQKRWVEFNDEREIANELGISHVAVGYWLDKYGIRDRIHPFIRDPEILHDLYIRRGKSVNELSEIYNVNNCTISRLARENNMSKKVHRANALGLRWAAPTIREMYEDGKSTIDIAEFFDLGGCARLLEIMDIYGIERREQSYYSGQNNKLWKGGPEGIYGSNWSEQRKLALERDNYECQKCGVSNEDCDPALHVHHKIPYREFDDDEKAHKLSNLISLCPKCHAQVEAWPLKPQ